MANRVLRDWTDSDRINELDFQAEVLFTRLMMKADDYGAFHANPKLINAFCFPLKNIRDTDITRWLHSLVSAGLIALYDADNKPYLHIINFGQRLRQMRRKFPQIPDNVLNESLKKSGQRVDSELTASCRPETETETESETESEGIINNSFVSINFDESVQNFQGNKKYFFLAYIFWELWHRENPNSRTMKDAKVGKWIDDMRKIIEIDKTSIERMIGIYCYFSKCAKQELGFDDFWYRTVKSIAAFRKKSKDGVYYIDHIIDRVNDKRDKDKDFLRYVDSAITKFNQNEKLK